MASIRKEVRLAVSADVVWSAIRDVGAVHVRVAKGVVTDTQMDGDVRIVTFANGMVARELIVDVDDVNCRLAYAIVDGVPRHYHASFQVFSDGAQSRVLWIVDVLPAELVPHVEGMMQLGIMAMQKTLQGSAAA